MDILFVANDPRFEQYCRIVWERAVENREFVDFITSRGPEKFAEALQIMAIFVRDSYEMDLTADVAADSIVSTALAAKASVARERELEMLLKAPIDRVH